MSKGEIVSGGTDGRYQVKLFYASDRIAEELARIAERIAELAVEIPEAKAAVISAEGISSDIARDIDLVIPDYQQNPEAFASEVRDLQRKLIAQRGEVARLTFTRDKLIAENLSLLKRRAQLQDAPTEETLEAWCADYTETLSGLVGLADINDEGGRGLVIRPGFADDAVYDPARDGSLFPNIAQSASQIYFNAAIMPGVQKWRPKYRVGEITFIDGDECSVSLDDAISSIQGLNINENSALSLVPIQYMDCNGAAFQAGDRVLINFTSSGPLVIGFEKEPVPCQLLRFAYEPSQYRKPEANVLRRFWGEPFLNGEIPINPPLGTESGGNPVWAALPASSSLTIEKGKPQNYGNRNWISKTKTVLSWEGPPARIFDNTRLFFNSGIPWPHPQFQSRWYTSTVVYHDLEVILDLTDHTEANGFSQVHGAAIHRDIADQRWLYVISSPVFFDAGQAYKAFRITVDDNLQPNGLLEFMFEFQPDSDMGHVTHWYFSDTGESAVCTFRNYSSNLNHTRYEIGRFSITQGFTVEQIFDRTNSNIGTDQYTFTRQASFGTVQTESQVYDGDFQTVTHLQPIYCEMIGSEEVMVYHRISGQQETNDYTAELFVNSDTGENYRESSQTISYSQSEPEAIVTSQGKVIYEVPKTESRSMTRQLKDDRLAETITASQNETETFGGLWLSYGTLAVDARFDFAMVAHAFVDQSFLIAEQTLPYVNPSASNPYVTFATSGTVERKDSLVAVLKGQTIMEKTLEQVGPSQASDLSYFRDSVQPNPNIDPTGSIIGTVSDTSPVSQSPPYIVGNPNALLDAAGYASGKFTFAGMAIRDTANNRDNFEVFSLLSEYENVIEDLIERTENDGYVLHRPGIF